MSIAIQLSELRDAFTEQEKIIMHQYCNALFWDYSSDTTYKFNIHEQKLVPGVVKTKKPEWDEFPIEYSKEHNSCFVSYNNGDENSRFELAFDTIGQADITRKIIVEEITREQIEHCFEDSRAMVKTTLMRSKDIEGVGNEFSDEILFQAGINPKKKASDLTEYDIEAIHDYMLEVYGIANQYRTNVTNYPSDSLTPRRYKGVTCPMCSGRIGCMKISGFDCYYCKDHQF